MKARDVFKGVSMLLLVALFSCSDETTKESKPDIPGGEVTEEVALVVKTKTKDNQTRAGETYPSEGEEATILDRKIKLYVYNADNGALEYFNEDLVLDNQYTTTVRLKVGEKYFYVFANTAGSNNDDAKNAEKKDPNTAYERQVVNVDFGATEDKPDLIAPNFVLGTLWREKKEVILGGTNSFVLNIGRIVAKVKLTEVDKGTKSTMKGDFLEPKYRVASVPTKSYWVGQYDHQNWTLLPPPGDATGKYGAVESVVHAEEPGTKVAPNPLFHDYPTYIAVTPLANPMTEFFYIIENTTQKDLLSYQYYGNTTHIRLETVYEPDPEEIYDATLQNNNQSLTNNNFWTVIHKGIRYITNAKPDDSLADAGTTIKVYDKGLNYHKFAIKDTNQSDVESRHSVYRNHFYQISVTGIMNLGEPTDEIDPQEPIPVEEDVELSVIVIDWSKIIQEEEI